MRGLSPPFGGSQDPCLLQSRDGTLLCASYAWTQLQPAAIEKLKQPMSITTANSGAKFGFLGGFLLRSTDAGRTWSDPIILPSVEAEQTVDIFGQKVPACNRGAFIEGSDGKLYRVIAATASMTPRPIRKSSSTKLRSTKRVRREPGARDRSILQLVRAQGRG